MIRHKNSILKRKIPRKGTLLAIYSRRMNSGEDLQTIIKKLFPWCHRWLKELKEIFKEYVNIKQQQNILDYDDLLGYWYHLLEALPFPILSQSSLIHILLMNIRIPTSVRQTSFCV